MEYIKDFDGWNEIKKKLDGTDQESLFNEKEIWWCNIGVNVGVEQDGKGSNFIRPVYILKKINHESFIGLPLSTRLKVDYVHIPFYFNYDFSCANISQIKIFDEKRLVRIIGITSDYILNKMKKATVAFIVS